MRKRIASAQALTNSIAASSLRHRYAIAMPSLCYPHQQSSRWKLTKRQCAKSLRDFYWPTISSLSTRPSILRKRNSQLSIYTVSKSNSKMRRRRATLPTPRRWRHHGPMRLELISTPMSTREIPCHKYSCLPVERTRLQRNLRFKVISMMFVWFTLISIVKKTLPT